MAAMPVAVTVWAVELGATASTAEVRGRLALASDALVFSPRDERLPERRFPLAEIARARRVRGSPVLMIFQRGAEGTRRVAFYFVQPPPLPKTVEVTPTSTLRRNTKRRARRQNVGYLGTWNREKKELLREWERQVRTAAQAAQGKDA
jgi:hypothetical protein